HEPRRLRIVDDDDVAGPDEAEQLREVLVQGSLVDLPIALLERFVSHVPVELVVDPLRHAEELVVALHHEPAGVPPRAELVAEDRSQHLRDTTPLGGRIDMPEPTPIQELTAASHGLL